MVRMNKLYAYNALERAYVECIAGNLSREYVFDELGLVLEVGPLEVLRTLSPSINSSMALELTDGRYLICIVKEDILAAPKEMQLMMLNFIFYHEVGHIVNGDQWDTNPDSNLIQEKKADEYSVKILDLSSDEACQMIECVYQRISNNLNAAEKTEQTKTRIEILTKARLARIEYIKTL